MLSGGEIAALALIDACVRLLPGVMGKEASGTEESFSDGLLEYPQYTRPQVFEGRPIPEILTSGDHAKVASLAAGGIRGPDGGPAAGFVGPDPEQSPESGRTPKNAKKQDGRVTNAPACLIAAAKSAMAG